MWFKPKGWDALSEEDKRWTEQVNKKNANEKLRECATRNWPKRVLYLLDNFEERWVISRYEAVEMAIKSNATESLAALLSKKDSILVVIVIQSAFSRMRVQLNGRSGRPYVR